MKYCLDLSKYKHGDSEDFEIVFEQLNVAV
jgi:hypothetical protein